MQLTFKELKSLFTSHTLNIADDVCVSGISRDTRNIKPGDVYVAIKGETHNGHDYVALAFEKGASAALVEEGFPQRANLIVVPDVIRAIGDLAQYYRNQFNQPVIAITGSNGKTTTKELLVHVLRQRGVVSATQGNLNNHIGVPFTIFEFAPQALFFVVEMGMNHPGEIAYLTKIARPTLGLITSIGQAHLEGVGGAIENVAAAKGELFAGLDPSATAVYFNDESLIAALPTRAQKMTYGFLPVQNIWVDHIVISGDTTRFTIHQDQQNTDITLALVGRHQVQNALAVFSIARQLGLTPDEIKTGIEGFRITNNRGRIHVFDQVTLIDDTYNANPDSMKAALTSLATQYPESEKIAVLGGMRELGNASSELHGQVGKFAKEIGIKDLFVYGQSSPFYLRSFGIQSTEKNRRFFKSHTELAEAVINYLQTAGAKRIVILFKGSRGMTMEKALEPVRIFLES